MSAFSISKTDRGVALVPRAALVTADVERLRLSAV